MKITIEGHTHEGKEFYEFTLQDGPDERERIRGYANDLVVAFSKIIEWTTRISADSAEEGIQGSTGDYTASEAGDLAS